MIIRHESDGSLVMITQNDHAKAAGFLASHWGNALFERPRPLDSTVRATFLHDFAWIGEEASPRFDARTASSPNYLDVPGETQLDACRWANAWLFGVDRYAGWLVSRHRTGIWRSRYGLMKRPSYAPRKLHPDVEAFVERSHAEQDAVAKGFDQDELIVNYKLLQAWDLFSLYICSNERLQEQLIEPVPTGYSRNHHAVCMRLTPVDSNHIYVEPFPFDQAALEVHVVHRRLPTGIFKDEQAFKSAYFRTSPQIVTFTFVDGNGSDETPQTR
jgi:Protein of unknown function (DUF3891)